VREIAELVAEAFPPCETAFGAPDNDGRSYRVSFDKIATSVPGFKSRWTARQGAEQLRDIFERVEMSPEVFGFRAFTRLKQLEHLIGNNLLDEQFFWRDAAVAA
jgi:hypothetical protein